MTTRVRRGERDLNPRVLSNMGLAIPRPTRLGDPRAVNRDLSIILSVAIIISNFVISGLATM
jgi:hypothetical protein